MTDPLLTASDRWQIGTCALGVLLFGCGFIFFLADDWATRRTPAWPFRAPFLLLCLMIVVALAFTGFQEALRGL